MIENKIADTPAARPDPDEKIARSSNGGPSVHETKLLSPPPEVKSLPAPAAKPRGRWTGLLWLLILGGLGYAGFRYYQQSEMKKAAAQTAQAERLAHRAVSIAVAQVHRSDLPVILRGLGTVTAYNTVNVKARIDGPIVKVNFVEGQMVKEGETLIEIDPRTYQVVVEQAEGQLARDQAQMNDAKVNLARYQKLWDEGVIAKQQFDTQGAQVGQFQGAIDSDQANIASAKLNLSFTKVPAPISGKIGLRQVDVGNIIHASDANPVAVITQVQPISVLFTLPADSLPPVLAKLHASSKLPVDAYDRADLLKIASGNLLTVDNTIDVNTGTSRLKAVFPNADGVLFPNQFVNCRLLLDTKRNVILVPAAAVQRGPQGAYVYLVKPDKTVTTRVVTVGTTEGNDTEVTKGLEAGDTIVTDGQDKLQEGSNVEVRPSSGSAPQTGGATPSAGTAQSPAQEKRGSRGQK